MDCTKVCSVDLTGVPSIRMKCVSAASNRDMITFTLDAAELPGQSTLNAKRVEVTNDRGCFWLLSPGAEVPLK